jgi:hypothetical protein
MDEISKQIITRGRDIRFFMLKLKEKDSANRREFYKGVNELGDLVHIKINILGSNLKQVLWMRRLWQK